MGATITPMLLSFATASSCRRLSSVNPLAPNTRFTDRPAAINDASMEAVAFVKSTNTSGVVSCSNSSKLVERGTSDPPGSRKLDSLGVWQAAPTRVRSSSRQTAETVSIPIFPVAPFTSTRIGAMTPPKET